MPFSMPDVHISLESHWPVVPVDDMVHKGPLRNINTPACPTNISQYSAMDRVLMMKILSEGRIKSCPTTRVRAFL